MRFPTLINACYKERLIVTWLHYFFIINLLYNHEETQLNINTIKPHRFINSTSNNLLCTHFLNRQRRLDDYFYKQLRLNNNVFNINIFEVSLHRGVNFPFLISCTDSTGFSHWCNPITASLVLFTKVKPVEFTYLHAKIQAKVEPPLFKLNLNNSVQRFWSTIFINYFFSKQTS